MAVSQSQGPRGGHGTWAYKVALGQSDLIQDPLVVAGRILKPRLLEIGRDIDPLRGHHRIIHQTLGLGQSSDHLEEQSGKIFKDFLQYSGAKCELSRELRRSDETTWTRVAVMADGSAGGSALFHV